MLQNDLYVWYIDSKHQLYKEGLNTPEQGKKLAKTKRKPNPKTKEELPEDTIQRFIAFLTAEGKSQGTIKGYVRILKDLQDFLNDSPFKTTSRQDLERYLAEWAERESNRVKGKSWDELGDGRTQKTSPAYMNFVRVVLKFFFKWLYGTETYPECIKWIKIKKIHQELDPKTILTDTEIYQMIRAAGNERDRALIHVLYETGGRIGEIRARKVEDVSFEDVEGTLTVKLMIPQKETKGKEKGKILRLIDSAEALKTWLAEHPNPKAEQPLWVSLYSHYGKEMSYSSILRMLKRVAKAVGITKPVNPHAFRHAQVTASAQYLSDQELKQKFGWTAGSQMLRVYSHLTDESIENKELEMRGITKIKRRGKRIISHVKCDRCGKIYSAGKTLCECGRPLDPDLAARWEQEKQELEAAQAAFWTAFHQTDLETIKKITELLKASKTP